MQNHKKAFDAAQSRRIFRESIDTLTNTEDWHKRLVVSLLVAHESVQSNITKKMIEELLAHLEQFDECAHRLSRKLLLPPWLDPHVLMGRIQEELICDSLQMELEKQTLHITALVRGTSEHAEQKLSGAIENALASAKRALLREL